MAKTLLDDLIAAGHKMSRIDFFVNHPTDSYETYLSEYVAWSNDGRTVLEHSPCLDCLHEVCERRGLSGRDYVVEDCRDPYRERTFPPCHHRLKVEVNAA